MDQNQFDELVRLLRRIINKLDDMERQIKRLG